MGTVCQQTTPHGWTLPAQHLWGGGGVLSPWALEEGTRHPQPWGSEEPSAHCNHPSPGPPLPMEHAGADPLIQPGTCCLRGPRPMGAACWGSTGLSCRGPWLPPSRAVLQGFVSDSLPLQPPTRFLITVATGLLHRLWVSGLLLCLFLCGQSRCVRMGTPLSMSPRPHHSSHPISGHP